MGIPTAEISGQLVAVSDIATTFRVYIYSNEEVSPCTSNKLVHTNCSHSNTLTEISNQKISMLITPDGLGDMTFDIPPSSWQSFSTGEWNLAATQRITIFDNTPPIVNVVASGYHIGNPYIINPFGVEITFDEDVTGFGISGVSILNGSGYNFTGSGLSYHLSIAPNGSGNIYINIPSGVAQNIVGFGNLASTEVMYEYVVPFVRGSTGISISGVYSNKYLDAFNNYGTSTELIYFEAKANVTGLHAHPIGWLYYIPSNPEQFNTYGDFYSGVPQIEKCFLDFNNQNMETTYSVKKSLNKNQIYGRETDIGKAYFPPTMVFTINEHPFRPTSDGVQWAKSQFCNIRDVWILNYDNFMWHISQPRARILDGELVFYESTIVKCSALNYDPWSFMYDGMMCDPVTGASGLFGQLIGGYYFPLDGGVY